MLSYKVKDLYNKIFKTLKDKIKDIRSSKERL